LRKFTPRGPVAIQTIKNPCQLCKKHDDCHKFCAGMKQNGTSAQ
jgi:hypothetical protein